MLEFSFTENLRLTNTARAIDEDQTIPSHPRLHQLSFSGNTHSDTGATDLLQYLKQENLLHELPDKDHIVIRGARQHNLKQIDISIPKHKLVVLTGVSGSGKSSLAFDTIFAEGQRRYTENISPFIRHYIEKIEKPQVAFIGGLNPTVALEQKSLSQNPRSNVGTITEIAQHLRLLFARLGVKHCLACGFVIHEIASYDIALAISELEKDSCITLTVVIDENRAEEYKKFRDHLVNQQSCYISVFDIPPKPEASSTQPPSTIPLARIEVPASANADFVQQVSELIRSAWAIGGDRCQIVLSNGLSLPFSQHSRCAQCGSIFPSLSSQHFSPHSPLGMCQECNGLGTKMEIDPQLLIRDPQLSILDGAVETFGNVRKNNSIWRLTQLKALADPYNVDLNTPWCELPQAFRDLILFGGELQRVADTEDFNVPVRGLVKSLGEAFHSTKSDRSRNYYASLMSQQPCTACHGTGLCAEAAAVTLGGKTITEVRNLSLSDVCLWLENLHTALTQEQQSIAKEASKEIYKRLQFMLKIGLAYLTLDRPAPTLSGGEGQRVRLTTQLSSELVGILYILDEPSIGLHPRDTAALTQSLLYLRDMGNSVLVVEHDAEIMSQADWLIDMGPGAGVLGGHVIAAGPVDTIMRHQESLTGRYLRGDLSIGGEPATSREQASLTDHWLTLEGCRLHNLKNVTLNIPLGVLTCVTGVSGSGKSSLINGVLYPYLHAHLQGKQPGNALCSTVTGIEHISKVVTITQTPIGKAPRSNPATYTGIFDDIRKLFAATPGAREKHFKADRFSFNVKGGRCESCQGYGQIKVEMHFLNDIWTTCRDCQGRRFNDETLKILYKGKNILDVLEMDIHEALPFFSDHPNISHTLNTLHEVGLDYMKLGQSATTLSGGEAQRIKLARELGSVNGKNTLYILDEPTTGLHFADIDRLLIVLQKLVAAQSTVIVIEHNLDVIKNADWVIDLGPDGGDQGGHIVAEGSPHTLSTREESVTGCYLRPFFAQHHQS